MELKVGAAYIRVSTISQEEYSPDSQLKIIREHAKRQGYIIPDEFIYQDDGISGKSADKRPAFRLMIAAAKEAEKSFDAIFVWKYSRFARNQEEAIMYKNLLRKKGVEVVSISEPSNDSPFASLIERIIEWMDEYYLINLAEEVRRGMREKSSRGEPSGKPAFGYRIDNKMLVPTENAATVRMIFEKYAAGDSIYKISTDLNDAGITREGRAFGKESVRYILKNPVYVGKIRWSEEQHVKYGQAGYAQALEDLPDGKHDPIINRELWDAVQVRMDRRHADARYVRQGKNVFMLKGLVRCSACGSTLTEVNKGQRREPGLQCCGYTRGSCRVSHYIKEANAEASVVEGLEQAIASGAYRFAPKKPHTGDPGQDWGKLITQEQTRLARAKEAYLGGVLSLDEYRDLRSAAEDNINKLEAARDKVGGAPVDAAAYSARVLDVLEILKAPDISGEAKNEALRYIIDRIVYNKQESVMDFYFLP